MYVYTAKFGGVWLGGSAVEDAEPSLTEVCMARPGTEAARARPRQRGLLIRLGG